MKGNRMKKIMVLLMASMLLTGCGQAEVINDEPGNIPQSETVSESGENDVSEIETEESKDAGESTEELTGSGAVETIGVTEETVEVEEPETEDETEEVVEEVKVGAYDEKKFFDYVNEKRVEAGLESFEWSDEMAEQAKELAKGWLEDDVEPEADNVLLGYAKTRSSAEFNDSFYNQFFDSFESTLMYDIDGKGMTEGGGAIATYYNEEGKFSMVVMLGAKQSYSFVDVDNVTYYALNSVNVRDLPSTEGDKIASLSKGEEVIVIGKCNETGWYKISDGNGGTGFVSNNYLSTEKPVIQVAENTAPTQGTQQDGTSPQGGYIEYTGGDSEEDYWDWVLDQAESGNIPMGYVVETTGEKWDSGRVDKGFIDYLNEQRVAAGLNPLEWASDLEELAKQRAVESVAEFANGTPHAGCRNCNGENLLGRTSSDIQSVYTQWYDSPGHRANMFNPAYTKAVYAVYADGTGMYYAVTLFLV